MHPLRLPRFVALCCALTFAAGLPVARAAQKGWSEDYELAENSQSPDGRYAVLLPSREAAEKIDEDKITNTLVDVKAQRRLAVIHGARYFPRQNHNGLTVTWAPDSSWCVVTYEERFGFGPITLVEPNDGKCVQHDLGLSIQSSLDAVINQQAHEKLGCCGSAHFRAGAERKILVRATGLTNPKSLEGQPTYKALFEGSFDLATGKWTHSAARKITGLEDDDVDSALTGFSDEGITYPTEEDRLKAYDAQLNSVYNGLRVLLPAERFAALKKEQIAWLKQLGAQDTTAGKCKLMLARIAELQRLAW